MLETRRNTLRQLAPLMLMLLLGFALSAVPGGLAAQVTAEDLRFGALAEGEVEDDLAALLARSEDLFYSAAQPDSIPLLSQIIDKIAPRQTAGLLPGESTILVRALTLRAEVRFNLGDSESAQRDLSAALTNRPGLTLDPQRVSPKLLALLDKLRDRTVGEIELRITPSDARVLLDTRILDTTEPVAAYLAGDYRARVERPGFAPVELELRVEAGARTTLEAQLERTSAVLMVLTRPSGVDVFVDGRAVGTTTTAEAAPDAESLSESMLIEVSEIGPHELLFSKDGFRRRRAGVSVEEFVDYTLSPIALEPARGTLRLSGIDPDSTLSIDGEMVSTARSRSGIELPPGEHLVVVDHGSVGRYERTVSIEDLQEVRLEVELEPTLVLLAIAAPSEGLARATHRELLGRLNTLETWHFVDRSTHGREILDRFGVDFGDPAAAVSWAQVQRTLDREVPASLYAVAVVRSDAGPREPEIWLWSPAPDPPAPTRWHPRQGELSGKALIEQLEAPLSTSTLWLGAAFLDSPIAAGPVVARLTSESPATAAGLTVGDVVIAVDGEATPSRVALLERLGRTSPGAAVTLTVEHRGSPADLRLQPGSSPFMPWPARTTAAAPIESVKLRATLATGTAKAWGATDTAAWLLRLRLAGLLLGREAWTSATELLESISAPGGAGLGQGTVDYWLGVALSRAGRHGQANQAFERAAAMRGARLHSHDGPRIAPRARARLLAADR